MQLTLHNSQQQLLESWPSSLVKICPIESCHQEMPASLKYVIVRGADSGAGIYFRMLKGSKENENVVVATRCSALSLDTFIVPGKIHTWLQLNIPGKTRGGHNLFIPIYHNSVKISYYKIKTQITRNIFSLKADLNHRNVRWEPIWTWRYWMFKNKETTWRKKSNSDSKPKWRQNQESRFHETLSLMRTAK